MNRDYSTNMNIAKDIEIKKRAQYVLEKIIQTEDSMRILMNYLNMDEEAKKSSIMSTVDFYIKRIRDAREDYEYLINDLSSN